MALLQEPCYKMIVLACLQEYHDHEGGFRKNDEDYGEVLIIVVGGVWCNGSLFDGLAVGGSDNRSNVHKTYLDQMVVPLSAEYGVMVCRGCRSLTQMKTSSWLQV